MGLPPQAGRLAGAWNQQPLHAQPARPRRPRLPRGERHDRSSRLTVARLVHPWRSADATTAARPATPVAAAAQSRRHD